MANEVYEITESMGSISYADDVIETIAGLACIDVPGIAGMSGGIMSGVTELLGRKDLTKGVKVELSQKDVKVDLNVIVDFGVEMHKVAEAAQIAVRKELETMSGLNVLCVNINIQGIKIDKDVIATKAQLASGDDGE